MEPENSALSWDLTLTGDVNKSAIEEVFDWVEDDCDLSISEITTTAINTNDNKVDEKTAVETEKAVIETPATTSPAPELKPATPKTKRKASTETSSIRVSIDKVDELINMVGELVITQSMLSQLGKDL